MADQSSDKPTASKGTTTSIMRFDPRALATPEGDAARAKDRAELDEIKARLASLEEKVANIKPLKFT